MRERKMQYMLSRSSIATLFQPIVLYTKNKELHIALQWYKSRF